MNNHFLNSRNTLKINLNTHITTCYHYTVGHADNFINILYTLLVFDFRNYFNILPADSLNIVTQNCYIRCTSYKWSCHKIKIVISTKLQICHISWWKIGHLQFNIRHINTLMICQKTAINNHTVNVCTINLFNPHWNKTVINQNCCAHAYISRQSLIIYITLFLIAHARYSCKCIPIAWVYNRTLWIFKITKPDFRPFCIKQCGNWLIEPISYLNYLIKSFFVILVWTVAEIKSRNIHTCFYHFFKHLRVIRCRTHSADDFCFLSFHYNTYSSPLPR